MTTKSGCGGVKTPPYRLAGTERLPGKGRYPQGCPSSGPAGPPSPAGEGLGAGRAAQPLRGGKWGMTFNGKRRRGQDPSLQAGGDGKIVR